MTRASLPHGRHSFAKLRRCMIVPAGKTIHFTYMERSLAAKIGSCRNVTSEGSGLCA
jgi:hypothetical protein